MTTFEVCFDIKKNNMSNIDAILTPNIESKSVALSFESKLEYMCGSNWKTMAYAKLNFEKFNKIFE